LSEQVEISDSQRGEFTEPRAGQTRGENENAEARVDRIGEFVQFIDPEKSHFPARPLRELHPAARGPGEQPGFHSRSERHRQQIVGEVHGGGRISVAHELGDPALDVGRSDSPKLTRSEGRQHEGTQIGVVPLPRRIPKVNAGLDPSRGPVAEGHGSCGRVDRLPEVDSGGYAQTSHATQGRTVDTALLLVDGATDSRGIYTPMTRGRNANHAYVVTDENQTAVDVLTQAITRDWIDHPAVTRRVELETRHQDPPRWSSLQEHHGAAPEPGRVAEPDQEPTHGDDTREDEHDADETRIQRLIDESLAAIQRRRRTTGRDQLTIGR
jgi:hypothetical protein